jgi:hypothetical protein
MIRMLIIGYVFAVRSERALCRDVQVNLAYRWFCGLSIEDRIIPRSHARAMSGFVTVTFSGVSSSMWWRPASRQGLSAAKGSRSMPA